MPGEHARCGRGLVDRLSSLVNFDGAHHLLQLFVGDSAGSQQARDRAGEIHDGRFDTYPAGATIEHHVEPVTELLPDVLGGGRADVTEPVGAGGGDRPSAHVDQAAGDRVIGHPHSNGRQAGRDD